MKELSLFYPLEKDPKFQKLSEAAVNDLSLDYIISHVAKGDYEKKLMLRVMSELEYDPVVIRYRSDIFEDFINNPEFRDKIMNLLIGKRGKIHLVHLGKFDLLAGIAPNQLVIDCLVQRSAENDENVFYSFRGKHISVFIRPTETVEKLLKDQGRKFLQIVVAEGGENMGFDRCPVALQRIKAFVDGIRIDPECQVFLKGHLRRFNVSAAINFGLCGCKLLANGLLRFAVNRLANGFTGVRVKPCGITCFPAPIRALANRANSVGVFVIIRHYNPFYRFHDRSSHWEPILSLVFLFCNLNPFLSKLRGCSPTGLTEPGGSFFLTCSSADSSSQ